MVEFSQTGNFVFAGVGLHHLAHVVVVFEPFQTLIDACWFTAIASLGTKVAAAKAPRSAAAL